MLIDVEKIKVTDRIRKDFGNIQELADDIKANGLINPPVVTPENDGTFTLLTGERRLRAMRSLGYKQIEVRTWSSLSDEQKLNIEISENEVRKDFSKAERIEYARRLEKVESLKAEERMKSGKSDPVENSPQGGKTRDIVAEKVGIGSSDTYRKEKYIVDNQAQLTPEDFADWDEGKLSTNKAYQKIKSQLMEKDSQIAGYKIKVQKAEEYKQTILDLENKVKELGTPKVETIVKEVVPENYESLKKENQYMINQNNKLRDERMQLLDKIREYEKNEPANVLGANLEHDCIFFRSTVNEFMKRTGGLAYLSDEINKLPEEEKTSYVKAVMMVKAWADNILSNIETNKSKGE